MPWTKQLSQLRDALAVQIPFREDVLPYLDDAGISFQNINLPQVPKTLWYNVLSYANNNNQLDALITVLLLHFPKNPHLVSFREQLNYDLGPEIDQEWKGADKPTLEKITGNSSTLLPISFLEVGIIKARSVARILIPKPMGDEAGTGFLLANNILLTNNHVLRDKESAKAARIQFNYQQSVAGLAIQPTEFATDPDNGFATSKEHDWTAVRLAGDPNQSFGAIDLAPVNISKNDFVNIIQHPGGLHKQIGMYHNVVTYCDDTIVQYLTDTEPGSSGSPVFNSQWQVVALHHSGGMIPEPGTKQKLLRNEGININLVIKDLNDTKL